MLGVDGGFAGRTKRNLIAGYVIYDIEDGQSPVSRHRSFLQGACGLKLAGCDRINHQAYLRLEDAARDALEQNFGLVAGANPLERVLLEGGCQGPVFWAVVDKNHGGTER